VNSWLLYLLLVRATLTSFSGLGSLPVLHDDLIVQRKVLTDAELNAAMAIGQASPGPLGLYIVCVGYFVAGLPGAVAGMAALATPALLAIPLLQLISRGRERIQGAITGIVIASCALMLLAAVRLAPSAVGSIPLALLACVSLVALGSGRVHPLAVVVAAALAGLVI
jgi:chromate transporter